MKSPKTPDSILQHLGEEFHHAGAVTPPIFQTSLFVHDTIAGLKETQEEEWADADSYIYSRIANPTNTVVEQKLAALEGTERAKIFGSGMAAISNAIMSCVRGNPGAGQGSKQGHVVAVDTCYGPTRQFLQDYLPSLGFPAPTFVSGDDPQEFIDATRPDTSAYYLESPGSIIFKIQDLGEITTIAKERGISTIIDNSYASPIFQQPAKFGVDMVAHSATKYLCGHSDVVAGALAMSRERAHDLVRWEYALFGGALAPFPAWLMLRGMRSLALRMRHHEKVGNQVAAWLQTQPAIERVFHVGLEDHPNRGLIQRQMSGTGSLLSFMPKTQDKTKLYCFVDRLQVFQRGISWGGFESLCVPIEYHPLDWKNPQWVIRLYCGLEDVGDLIGDLAAAIADLE